ncbi:hypothetical protein PLICRDRAFT_609235 [Plicaturopsis crispa FD-325 SS-3]|nr:hypothetical protein PLICRDRAFT_609235 [Plicaturopsis crispa FD-325 SS-3]
MYAILPSGLTSSMENRHETSLRSRRIAYSRTCTASRVDIGAFYVTNTNIVAQLPKSVNDCVYWNLTARVPWTFELFEADRLSKHSGWFCVASYDYNCTKVSARARCMNRRPFLPWNVDIETDEVESECNVVEILTGPTSKSPSAVYNQSRL